MAAMDEVIIVGAGPVGLWLACELRLGGVPVTVLETRDAADPHSKGPTLHPRTLEIFDCRGLIGRFLAEGMRIPSGHFGALPDRLDFSVLDTPYPFTLALPQARTEQLFQEHALAAGVRILRGRRVTGLTPEPGRVVVELDGHPQMAAAWVVGCDGTRSTVRAAAGIDFPGTDVSKWGWLGDMTLDEPPTVTTIHNTAGSVLIVPLPGGRHRLIGGDPSGDGVAKPGPLTLEEMRGAVRRIAGTDFGMRDPVWLSRFGNAARQAARYREGRVLVAGDAAHMHFAAGGVGLNVGVQDATNLGWKLAAVCAGRAGSELLDTYHDERHPVGAELLTHTSAQNELMTAYTPNGQALRSVLSRHIAAHPDLSRTLAERLSGLDVDYPGVGRRVPNRRLADGTSLFERLRTGRHVVLDPSGTDDAEAVLVRPDGHPAAT
jgi:2-polyprenyl-6-methoxyphenol hydroxylase-like FAD-dependent oxidoreductase